MLDVHELVIAHAAVTYFGRLAGESAINAAIWEGELLVVEKAIDPSDGSITVASINGAFPVKRLHLKQGEIYLVPENPLFQPTK